MKVITLNGIRKTASSTERVIAENLMTTSGHTCSASFNPATMMENAGRAFVEMSRQVLPSKVLKEHEHLISGLKNKSALTELIQKMKPNSQELEDLDTLLKCAGGKKPIITPAFLEKYAENPVLSQNIREDLKIIRQKGELIDNYIPTYKTKTDAWQNARKGDVFRIENEETVSMLTDSGRVEPLSMRAEDYMELFPPVSRFINIQGHFGNCYEVTALNELMENPQTRERIYKSIDTISGDGIKIRFLSGTNKKGITIKPSELDAETAKGQYSSGCKGIQSLEYALSKEYETDFISYHIKEALKRGDTATANKIKTLYAQGNTGAIAEMFGGNREQSLGTNLREGGDAAIVWSKFGFKKNGEYAFQNYSEKAGSVAPIRCFDWAERFITGNLDTSEELFKTKLKSPDFFKNHLVQVYVNKENRCTNLMPGHSYRLSPVYDEKGKITSFTTINPLEGTARPLDLNSAINSIDYITYARIHG